MIELVWGDGFKTAYKKRIKPNPLLKQKFFSSLYTFVENPFEPSLRTHKLSGKLAGLWAFSVDIDSRLVFRFLEDGKKALLIDIGTHEEVY